MASGGYDDTLRLWSVPERRCLTVVTTERPYERMNITGDTGLSQSQLDALKLLGAVESP